MTLYDVNKGVYVHLLLVKSSNRILWKNRTHFDLARDGILTCIS